MGTPDFAVPTLDALVEAGHDVCLVVAQPDRPKGRGRKMVSPPTIERARELGIPTAQPRAIKTGRFPARVKALEADVAVVIAYGRILTAELLEAPRHGCINLHASLLPQYRGSAPIQWAVTHGDAVTGVCAQQMELSLDTGPLYVSESTEIGPEETAGELHDRLMVIAARVAVEALAAVARGDIPTPQDHEQATFAPMLEKEDGRVDWSWPAQRVHDRIRGMSPWPGAFTDIRSGEVLKLKASRVTEGTGTPGTLLETRPRLVVACGEGAVELTQVQAAGKRAVSGFDWANGARREAGEAL